MSDTVEVPQVNEGGGGEIIQGTPRQFSKAAFFHLTFISSRLKGDFLIISTFPGSFIPLLTGLPSLGVICPKHINGTIIISKILIAILIFLNLL